MLPDGSEPLPRSGLREGEIHLWHIAPDPAADYAPLERLLQADELSRYRGISFERRRREYLLTRTLVRSVLSIYSPTPPSAWRFRSNRYGRPELDPPSPIRFNLSHCDGMVACIVARDRQIGVDVEPAASGSAILDLAPRVFSLSEQETLSSLDSVEGRRNLGLAIWTLKEAYVKARGVGLSLPLRSLTFAVCGSSIRLQAPAEVDPNPDEWTFAAFGVGTHRAAIAAGPGPGQPALRLWPIWPPGMANSSH